MVFIDKPLEIMLEEIGFNSFLRFDYLVPQEEIERYDQGQNLHPDNKYIIEVLQSIASNGKKLDSSQLMNIGYMVGFVLENAFTHGNQRSIDFPVSLKVLSGDHGVVVRIRDAGIGFDFKEKINQMRAGDSNYFTGAGYGLQMIDRSSVQVGYEDKGSTVNLMHLF